MGALIAIIILFISFLGISLMLYLKIPVLVKLPEVVQPRREEDLLFLLKKKIQEKSFLKEFSYEKFLKRLLFRIKILTLKVENKTLILLQKLREREERKKKMKEDTYWEEIKKSTKKSK